MLSPPAAWVTSTRTGLLAVASMACTRCSTRCSLARVVPLRGLFVLISASSAPRSLLLNQRSQRMHCAYEPRYAAKLPASCAYGAQNSTQKNATLGEHRPHAAQYTSKHKAHRRAALRSTALQQPDARPALLLVPPRASRFSVLLEAGSTGTRVYVYERVKARKSLEAGAP